MDLPMILVRVGSFGKKPQVRACPRVITGFHLPMDLPSLPMIL